MAQDKISLEAAKWALDLKNGQLLRLEDILSDGIASRQQVEEARAAWREAKAKWAQSELELEVAQSHLAREKALRGQGLLADDEAQAAYVEWQSSLQQQASTSQVLESLGADPEGVGGLFAFSSSASWQVVAQGKALGEHVLEGDSLYTLADFSRVWCWVEAPPELRELTRPGRRVKLDLGKGKLVTGKIGFREVEAERETQKSRFRVELDNQNHQLQPNQWVEVLLFAEKSRPALTLPEGALVSRQPALCYWQEEPGHYVRQVLKLGQRSQNRLEVLDGLQPGALVVTEGAVNLEAQFQLQAAGGGGHDH